MRTQTDETVDALILALGHEYNADMCRAWLSEIAAADRPFVSEVMEKGYQRIIGAPFFEIEARLAKIDAALADRDALK